MEIKIGTWLPLFPGFYGAGVDFAEDDAVVDMLKERYGDVPGFDDWVETFLTCSKAYCDMLRSWREEYARRWVKKVEELLKDFVQALEFQLVISPKEYNFANDSIDVLVTLSDDNKQRIAEYVGVNFDLWEEYLEKNYSPRDGFIPYFSNSADSEDWRISEALESSHQLGAILNFVLENNGSEWRGVALEIESPSYVIDAEGVINEFRNTSSKS